MVRKKAKADLIPVKCPEQVVKALTCLRAKAKKHPGERAKMYPLVC